MPRNAVDRERGRSGEHRFEDARTTKRLDDCARVSPSDVVRDTQFSSMPSV